MDAPREYRHQADTFTIMRGADAPALDDVSPMTYEYLTPTAAQGLERLGIAGIGDGADVRVVFDAPGFSLISARFKSRFPLPRHSHRADCLYYVIGGSLRLGTETLVKGDGFFVPAGTPYTYVPGDDGVEILEFRHDTCTDIRVMAGAAFFEKAVSAMPERRAEWSAASVT